MSTHHKATALRYLDHEEPRTALVHAELETAAQIERMADGLEAIKKTLDEIGAMAIVFLQNGGMQAMFKPFNPEDN